MLYFRGKKKIAWGDQEREIWAELEEI